MKLFLDIQVLKDSSDRLSLCVARGQVNEADDAPFGSPQGGEQLVEPHLTMAFRTSKD